MKFEKHRSRCIRLFLLLLVPVLSVLGIVYVSFDTTLIKQVHENIRELKEALWFMVIYIVLDMISQH